MRWFLLRQKDKGIDRGYVIEQRKIAGARCLVQYIDNMIYEYGIWNGVIVDVDGVGPEVRPRETMKND